MVRLGLDLWQDANLLAYLQGAQDPSFEIRPEQLPAPVAKILREHKAEFGDTIDSADELKKLMKMLEQTGGDLNGLKRPEFRGLEGLSSHELLQLLIDWLQNGGAQSNNNNNTYRPRMLGNLNGGGGGGGGGGYMGAPMSTGGRGNNGVQGPIGSGTARVVDAPPGTQYAAKNVPWISQFDSSRVEGAGPVACYRACRAMMAAAGINQPAGIQGAIQIATGEDANGRISTNPQGIREGVNYIDEQLQAGRPVTVGVSYKDADYNEGFTDHFVVITGKGVDEQGRVFYTYQDPGSNQGQNRKFYVDQESGNLYDPNSAFNAYFEMSMVVPAS